MKNQRDKLHQYQRRITVLTDRETAIAKECLAHNDRRRALLALRRKKYQESLLTKTDAQLAQLEQLTNSVEFALVQKDVLFGLQQGTNVLQAIHKEMGGLEGVEKLMGESEEARAYQEVRITSSDYIILQFTDAIVAKIGNQSDARWTNVESRRRRSRGRARGPTAGSGRSFLARGPHVCSARRDATRKGRKGEIQGKGKSERKSSGAFARLIIYLYC